MAVYESALRRREPVAEGTAAFYFEKPAGFAHQAGQNAVFTLVDPPETDSQVPSRAHRRPEDAAVLDELRALERGNPNYRLIATMAEAEKSSQPWNGETGFIRPDMLERYLIDLKNSVHYCAGPPGMTMAMQSMLEGLGVNENDIRSEEFYGY